MKRVKPLDFVKSFKPLAKSRESRYVVPVYSVNENAETICTPTPEFKSGRIVHDAKSVEIANLLYGAMPESLAQVNMSDQMVSAEKITDYCVRRFGDLNKQRAEIMKKFDISNE
jgi:hypothetical protein